MDPDATGQVSDAIVSEGVADSVAESAEAPAEFTMADAFAAARAETEAAAAPSEDSTAESSQPEGDEQPQAGAEQHAEASAPPEKPVTTQGVLDRIQTLVAQGREAELTPEERGVYNRVREAAKAEVLKTQAEEKEFRRTYLDFERLRLEDPDSFAEKVLENPDIVGFMRSYKAANPEVSLENPEPGPRQPSPDEVRQEMRSQYNDAITNVVKAVAADAGVDYDAVAKDAEGKLGTVLTRLVDAAIKVGIEKALPDIKKAEREAAALEAQALYANKTIVTPKVMGAGVTDPRAARPSGGGPISMREAAELARQEMAASGR